MNDRFSVTLSEDEASDVRNSLISALSLMSYLARLREIDSDIHETIPGLPIVTQDAKQALEAIENARAKGFREWFERFSREVEGS